MAYQEVSVKQLYRNPQQWLSKQVELSGWLRQNRSQKELAFIAFNDGSFYTNVQIVAPNTLSNFDTVAKVTTGSTIRVRGVFQESTGAGQGHEIIADQIEILGLADSSNPIQNKRHSMEFLRTIPHLRVRTNTFMAVFRVRSLLAHAIHSFFQDRGFVYVHTPIITSADAEGAGEMFRVTTIEPRGHKTDKQGNIKWQRELLGKRTYLTVSGQLNVETFCTAFRNVYTFGPTFRAENSNTPRHASEFWMIEPEISFGDLNVNMDLAEDMTKFMIQYLLDHASEEMDFFNTRIDTGLLLRLENIVKSDFARITYTEAIDLLQKSGKNFEFPPEWGVDLQTEHERFLAEETFQKPVFVTDYPKTIKAFYMRRNEDGKTVRAMDMLVPGVGELIGGSQREERLDVLLASMEENGIAPEEYKPYVDLRRFGTFEHSGFGLGFERAMMYMTGMKNIRDVIPYPRTPKNVFF